MPLGSGRLFDRTVLVGAGWHPAPCRTGAPRCAFWWLPGRRWVSLQGLRAGFASRRYTGERHFHIRKQASDCENTARRRCSRFARAVLSASGPPYLPIYCASFRPCDIYLLSQLCTGLHGLFRPRMFSDFMKEL